MQTKVNVDTSIRSYTKFYNSWANITKISDGINISYGAQKVLPYLKYVIEKDRKARFKDFIFWLDRSHDQIKRYFNELEDAGIVKISLISSLVVNNKKLRNILNFEPTEKGRLELDIKIKNTTSSNSEYSAKMRTKISSTQYIYDNNNKKYLDKLDIQKNSITPKKTQSQLSKFFNLAAEEEGKLITVPLKLIEIDPISEDEAYKIRLDTDRDYSCNFMNQLLKKLQKLKPNNIFYNRTIFLKYFRSVIRNELRTKGVINSENFTMRINMTEEQTTNDNIEKFLANIELSYGTSKEEHLKRKLASVLSPKIAHELLSNLSHVKEPQIWDYTETMTKEHKAILFVLHNELTIPEASKAIISREVRSIYGNHIEKIVFKSNSAIEKLKEKNSSKGEVDLQLSVEKPTFSDTFYSVKNDILKNCSNFKESDFSYVLGDALSRVNPNKEVVKVFVKKGYSFMLTQEIIKTYEDKGFNAAIFVDC